MTLSSPGSEDYKTEGGDERGPTQIRIRRKHLSKEIFINGYILYVQEILT